MFQDLQTPCYIIRSDGFRDHVSYVDDWCYGKTRHVGTFGEYDDARDAIKADIRRAPGERNGLPLYLESDHGNISRARAIRLRKGVTR